MPLPLAFECTLAVPVDSTGSWIHQKICFLTPIKKILRFRILTRLSSLLKLMFEALPLIRWQFSYLIDHQLLLFHILHNSIQSCFGCLPFLFTSLFFFFFSCFVIMKECDFMFIRGFTLILNLHYSSEHSSAWPKCLKSVTQQTVKTSKISREYLHISP